MIDYDTSASDSDTVAIGSEDVRLSLDQLKLKAQEIRIHVLDMVYEAQSGHIGGSFSEAEILAALYFRVLKLRPSQPDWDSRDRFVLSKGHACPAFYAALAMRGFFPIETLRTLRQFGSILQGHPIMKTPGVEVTTGSLGVGFASAVGIALEAQQVSRRSFSVFALLGDGELNEGVVWEAAQTANKYRLCNLVAIVDRNRIQNDDFSDTIMPLGPIDKKFEAFGWKTATIDGHDIEAVVAALEEAQSWSHGPYCIIADTVKGKGVSFMENDPYWHGKPPTEEQYEKGLAELKGAMK